MFIENCVRSVLKIHFTLIVKATSVNFKKNRFVTLYKIKNFLYLNIRKPMVFKSIST